jgi:hypothetical protein
MNKFLLKCLSLGVIAGVGLIASCSDDDDFAAPTIALSITEITAAPGEDVSVTVTTTTDAGFQSLVVKKLWEDDVQDEETITTAPTTPYVYTVTEEDADHVVKLNFTVTDKEGRTAAKDLVITVELTPLQVLLKYDWRLNEEIWKDDQSNQISDPYKDDIYRFNEDGTYQKSIGANADDFNDLITNYCFYDLNENTMRLLMSKYDGWNQVDITDTLDIVLLNDTEMRADVTYLGLDQLDPKYDESEPFQKRFVAVPKASTFDPYMPGATDDETGPVDHCTDVVFEND